MSKPISPYKYEYIKCIGYNPLYAHACGKKTDITKTSPKMFARVSQMFPDADLKAFGKIQGTFHTTMDALKKYDHNKQFNVPLERRKQIIETFQIVHKEMAQSINTLTDYDVSMKLSLNKSPGRLFTALQREPKIHTKFDALCECWGVVQQLARDPDFETLFQGSAKTERIKIIKILEKDPRLFITVSLEFVWRGMILFSEISDFMFSKADNFNYPWKIGMQMIHGSLFGLFNSMKNYKYKSDDDVKRWDSSFLNESFDMISELKKWMHNPNDPNMTQFDYEELVDSYYTNIKSPCVVMPDGHIYQFRCGQMSGLYTTGQDNSLNHELIKIHEYLEILGSPTAYSQNYLTNFNFGIVGDDIVNGTNFYVPPEHTERCYSDFGFQVKIAESHRSEDINGLRFCSFTYSDTVGSGYEERLLFDRNKILCSLVNEPIPLKRSLIDVYITRISMLCLLAAFDNRLCQFLIDIYFDLRKEYKAQITPSYVMDPSYLCDLWSGAESSLAKYIPKYFFQDISREYFLFAEYSKREPHCLIPDIVEWNQEDTHIVEIDQPLYISIIIHSTCSCGLEDYCSANGWNPLNLSYQQKVVLEKYNDIYCPRCWKNVTNRFIKLIYKKIETNIIHPGLDVSIFPMTRVIPTYYSDEPIREMTALKIVDEFDYFRYTYIQSIVNRWYDEFSYWRLNPQYFTNPPEHLDYFIKQIIQYHSNIYWLMKDPLPIFLTDTVYPMNEYIDITNITKVHAFPTMALVNYVSSYRSLTVVFRNNGASLKRIKTPSSKFNLRACGEIDKTGFELEEDDKQVAIDAANFLAAIYN